MTTVREIIESSGRISGKLLSHCFIHVDSDDHCWVSDVPFEESVDLRLDVEPRLVGPLKEVLDGVVCSSVLYGSDVVTECEIAHHEGRPVIVDFAWLINHTIGGSYCFCNDGHWVQCSPRDGTPNWFGHLRRFD